jgi:hypothetical protein
MTTPRYRVLPERFCSPSRLGSRVNGTAGLLRHDREISPFAVALRELGTCSVSREGLVECRPLGAHPTADQTYGGDDGD